MDDPRLAIDASGNAVAVWAGGNNGFVQAAIRPGASGEWQPPIELSSAGASGGRLVLSDGAYATEQVEIAAKEIEDRGRQTLPDRRSDIDGSHGG